MSGWRRWRAAAVVAVLAAGVLVGAASPSAAALTPGLYWIKNDASGSILCLRADSRTPVQNGPLVGMSQCNPFDNQMLWQITPVDPQPVTGLELYFVRNVANGGCLDMDNRGGRITFVAHVIPCWGGATNAYQLWALPTPAGSGQIWPLAGLHVFGLDNSRDISGGFGQRVNIWQLSSTYNAAQAFSVHINPGIL
jgi:hypothetical protein